MNSKRKLMNGPWGVMVAVGIFALVSAVVRADDAKKGPSAAGDKPTLTVAPENPVVPTTPPVAGDPNAPAPAPAEAGTPKIVIDEPDYKFGELWSGKPVDHTYIVKNTGDGVLKITAVKPACGCTVAKEYDKEILPGQTGKIPVTISTAKMKNAITKAITVTCNDPANASVKLSIGGTLKERISMEPATAGNFGRLKPGETGEQVVTLKNNTDQPVELTLPAEKVPGYATILEAKTPGQLYELKIKAEGPFPDKQSRSNLVLKTNNPDQATVEIPLSVFIPAAIEVTPPEVIIQAAQEAPRNQKLAVRLNTPAPAKVTAIESDNPEIKVAFQETKSGEYNVDLTMPGNYLPPADGHKLTIKTDDAKNPQSVVKIMQTRQVQKPPAPERPAMKLSGQPVPPATFKTADGKVISTTENEGKNTLVFCYASWCGFCKRALPKVNEMWTELKDKDVRFVGVSLDTLVEDGNDPTVNKRAKKREEVTNQWTELGIQFPLAFDSDKHAASKFMVQSFPTLYLINKSGKVERVYVGGQAAMDGSLKKDIEEVLAGKALPPPPVETAAAPQPPQPKPADLAGKPAPAATFPLVGGGNLATADQGQVTLSMFYASWCGYCKKSLPGLSELYNSYKDQPVRFVGVSQDTLVEDGEEGPRAKKKADVEQQWKDLKATFALAFDPAKAGREKFLVQSYPTLVLIGKTGVIERVYVGAQGVTDGSIKKDIDDLLAGKNIREATAKADAGAPPAAGAPALTVERVK